MPHILFNYIKDFFEAGIATHQPLRSKILRVPVKALKEVSLLEQMTSHRGAELQAQYALYPYLLEKYPLTVREWKNGSTIADFFIPDVGPHGVAIEMKHFSAHQTNQLQGLLGPSKNKKDTLAHDLYKPLPNGTILMQIGMFTAVESLTVDSHRNSACHFVRTYVNKPLALSQYEPGARHNFENWKHLRQYVTPRGDAISADFIVPAKQHVFGTENDRVAGRVNFVVLISKASLASSPNG
ncbi:hypothetical protein [Pseudoduganella danionis]|uniref:hypothetical protein n=1 Tax=Pseudoduganella danionis TaxID=1890295 RepID=UPI0035AEDA1E